MAIRQLVHLPDVSDAISIDLELSNHCLAAAAWLRREHLPHTARLLLTMSDAHAAIALRLAQCCGRRGRPALLRAQVAPRAVHASVREAAGDLLGRERDALAALDAAATRTSPVQRSLAHGLTEALPERRRLVRTATILRDAADEHGSDPAQLERWALREEPRFRAVLAHRPAARPATAAPVHTVSARSRR
jgi:hypothetical protein